MDVLSAFSNIPKNEVSVFMITMGKKDPDSNKIRCYKNPTDEFVEFYS